ncbi:MAG: hypothetical protein ACLFV7_01100 [Phycisphaerae bacterium]
MMDNDNLDHAKGRLSAIRTHAESRLGFSVRRKVKLGAGRLGIIAADDEDDVDVDVHRELAERTLVTGTDEIVRDGEPDLSSPPPPVPSDAPRPNAVDEAPSATTREDSPAEASPPSADLPSQTEPADQQSQTPQPAAPAQEFRRQRPGVEPAIPADPVVELPDRKKGTYLLPLRTILEIKAFASLTKITQYEVVDRAVSQFIAAMVEEMDEPKRERMSELVKRHAYKARVAAEKRARGRRTRGKRLDLTTRWEPPEDGRMAHFARRVTHGNDEADEHTED